jgi:hypothetical protein
LKAPGIGSGAFSLCNSNHAIGSIRHIKDAASDRKKTRWGKRNLKLKQND